MKAGFEVTPTAVESIGAAEVVQALVDAGVLNSSVKLNSFQIVEGKAQVDFSKEFVACIKDADAAVEHLNIGSVVNTFIDAFQIPALLITVEGKTWTTGLVKFGEQPFVKIQ